MAYTHFSGPVASANGFEGNVIGSVTSATPVATVSGTAATAGGVQALQIGSGAGLGVYFGSGAPTVSAAQGSLYLRTDGSSTSTRAYINTDGGTTWAAVTTAA